MRVLLSSAAVALMILTAGQIPAQAGAANGFAMKPATAPASQIQDVRVRKWRRGYRLDDGFYRYRPSYGYYPRYYGYYGYSSDYYASGWGYPAYRYRPYYAWGPRFYGPRFFGGFYRRHWY